MLRTDYKKPNFSVPNTFLDFVIISHKEVMVKATYEFITLENFDDKIILNGDNSIDLKNILINDEMLSKNDFYFLKSNYGEDLIIEKKLENKKNKIEINVVINPSDNTSLSGLYVSDGILTTQCESHGFRKIVYSFDRPDILSKFQVRVVDKSENKNIILSNGNTITDDSNFYPIFCSYSSVIDINSVNVKIHEDPFPKPTYLFALVVGQLGFIYDTFETMNKKTVDLFIYTKKEQLSDAKFAMSALKRSMKHDEDIYGLEYDLDNFKIVAIDDFNAGAMENKGLNIFNSKFILANPDYTSDDTYAFIDAVVAHEYFHNYTGNRVTVRDWFELTLKEGLTVFRDQEYSENVDSYFSQRLEQISSITNIQFNEDLGPLSHPIRPEKVESMNNFYSSTVYNKGAEVIRMIKTIIGDELFHESIKYYLKKHDGQAVSCEDFVLAIEEKSNFDLSQFRLWYSQNGVPEVYLTRSINENNELIINLNQVFNKKDNKFKPFLIPFKYKVFDTNGDELLSDLIILKDENLSYNTKIKCHSGIPIISGLTDFSAPVLYFHDMSKSELSNLLMFETNLISKISTFTNFQNNNFTEIMRGDIEYFDELNFSVAKDVISFFINNETEEFDYIRMFLFPSSLNDIKTNFEIFDLKKYYKISDMYKKTLVEYLGFDLISRAYEKINKFTYNGKDINNQSEFSYKMQKARSLRSTLINLLGFIDFKTSKQKALEIEEKSTTFSDKINFLKFNLLLNEDKENLNEIIIKYNEIFIKEKKCYSTFISMVSSGLMVDIDYAISLFEKNISFKNPNLVSAFLIGISQNRRFYSNDGKYVEYVANKVLSLDKTNSNLSSKIVKILNYYKSTDEVTFIKKEALNKIANSNISVELKEVVTNLLI